MKPSNATEGNHTTPPQKIAQRADLGPLRASVRCGDCQHFTPDAVNPPQGMGTCALTLTGLPPPPIHGNDMRCCYPMAPRRCASYAPKGAA